MSALNHHHGVIMTDKQFELTNFARGSTAKRYLEDNFQERRKKDGIVLGPNAGKQDI